MLPWWYAVPSAWAMPLPCRWMCESPLSCWRTASRPSAAEPGVVAQGGVEVAVQGFVAVQAVAAVRAEVGDGRAGKGGFGREDVAADGEAGERAVAAAVGDVAVVEVGVLHVVAVGAFSSPAPALSQMLSAPMLARLTRPLARVVAEVVPLESVAVYMKLVVASWATSMWLLW